MNRTERPALPRRERRRRFERGLKRILKLDMEGHSLKVISDSLQLSERYVTLVIERTSAASNRPGERTEGEGGR